MVKSFVVVEPEINYFYLRRFKNWMIKDSTKLLLNGPCSCELHHLLLDTKKWFWSNIFFCFRIERTLANFELTVYGCFFLNIWAAWLQQLWHFAKINYVTIQIYYSPAWNLVHHSWTHPNFKRQSDKVSNVLPPIWFTTYSIHNLLEIFSSPLKIKAMIC